MIFNEEVLSVNISEMFKIGKNNVEEMIIWNKNTIKSDTKYSVIVKKKNKITQFSKQNNLFSLIPHKKAAYF